VDEFYMEMALEEARKAKDLGEVPIGAVLVKDGEVLAKGFNLREKEQQVTAHAEILAIRQGNQKLQSWRLTDTTLYVTMEPCVMCGGAIIQSRIARVVFGAYDPKGGAGGSVINLFEQKGFNHQVIVTGGVLEAPCSKILTDFFQDLRERNRKQKALKKLEQKQ
jgi:tRNA(adenine34) deaminase